jgi:hypothetical protein
MDDWVSLALSTDPIDRAAAKSAALSLYREYGESEPVVVFVDSPADMIYHAVRLWWNVIKNTWVPVRGYSTRVEVPELDLDRRIAINNVHSYSPSIGPYFLGQAHNVVIAHSFSDVASIDPPYFRARQVFRVTVEQVYEWGRFSDFSKGWRRMKKEGLESGWAYERHNFLNAWSRPSAHGPNPLHAMAWQMGGPSPVESYLELARNCSWSHLTRAWAFIMDRPTEIHFDDDGRLSNWPGPAIKFRDGSGIYRLQDMEMPKVYGELTAGKIHSFDNVEVRRALRETMGMGEYLRQVEATLVAEDEVGKLWRYSDVGTRRMMVQVVNSTPELDGTYREFFLRVPVNMSTPKQAVAWTFNMTEEEYAPVAET